MNRKNYLLLSKTSILLFCVISLLLVSCEKNNSNDDNSNDDPNPTTIDLYALDISEETDWDYVVAADNEEGSSVWFNIDRTTNIPETMFFKPFNNQDDGFVVKFQIGGLPDYAVFGDTIVVFENFKGTKCDVAVIYPNISIKYFDGIETGVNWDNILTVTKNSSAWDTRIAFEHGLKFIGATLGVISVAAAVTAISAATSPLIIAAVAVGAAITAYNIVNSYFDVGIKTNTGTNVLATILGCVTPTGTLSCVTGIASTAAGKIENRVRYANSRQPIIDAAREEMKQNEEDPEDPEDPEERTLSVTLTSTMGGEGGSFSCVLKPDGVCLVRDVRGRWSQSGNNLGIEWTLNNEFNCRYRLTGTVGGNLYRGTYTHHDHGSTLYDEGKFNGEFQ